MPRLVEMGDLITRAKLLADKENDDHISDAAWRLFAHLVYNADVYSTTAEASQRYFEYVATLTTSGAAYVSEPSDHLETIRLDYVASSTDRRQLIKAEPGDEPMLAALTGTEPVYYAMLDDRIYLYPTPSSGLTLELRYTPQPPDLTTFADDTCVDCVSPDGESCLTWGMAQLALERAKQDARDALGHRLEHKQAHLLWSLRRNPLRRTVADADLGDLRDAGDWP